MRAADTLVGVDGLAVHDQRQLDDAVRLVEHSRQRLNGDTCDVIFGLLRR